MTSEPARSEPVYWWVNQRYTFEAERKAGILWAPERGPNGRPQVFWESMHQVIPGDRIIHYVDGRILATSTAATGAFDSRRPSSLGSERWDEEGRMVRTNYTTLTQPIDKEQIDPDRRTSSPFTSAGTVRQGYLFPIDPAVTTYLTAAFEELRWDVPFVARYVPDEARGDATDLLKQLLGVPLLTAQGQKNTILEIRSGSVLVATDRSSAGTEVPIRWVAQALERLAHDGILEITVQAVGHRSAFVGAVLRTLPGAHLVGSPPKITFDPDQLEDNIPETSESSSAANVGFAGALHKDVVAQVRGEQPKLRSTLIGAAKSACCAICDTTYPVHFLWTAHIKKRARCTDEEARDLSHIAMLACLFGCDALYEAGLIRSMTRARSSAVQLSPQSRR